MTAAIETTSTRTGLARIVGLWRGEGLSVAMVPTMGALHDGHLALVAAALRRCDRVVASIFVNPAQFAPHEDFGTYPRTLATDLQKLAGAGCHLVHVPHASEIYPPGDSTTVAVSGVSEPLEGQFRPHFFGGVATVVARLLIHCLPDLALFGEKDWQQLQVIRRMTEDLGLPVAIEGVPTVREADGLAMSSRNAYLSAAERQQASALFAVMTALAESVARGALVADACDTARQALFSAGFEQIDYCTVADAMTLAPLGPGPLHGDIMARVLVAAWLGTTRLIDNCAAGPAAG